MYSYSLAWSAPADAPRDAEFDRFDAWSDTIFEGFELLDSMLAQRRAEPEVLRRLLGADQRAFSENIVSPFYYQYLCLQQAKKIEDNDALPNVFAALLREAAARVKEKLEAEPALAEDCFLDDVVNHVILYSESKTSVKTLQNMLAYYESLVDDRRHDAISLLVDDFIAKGELYRSDVSTLFSPLPSARTRAVLDAINDVFEADLEELEEEAEEPQAFQVSVWNVFTRVNTLFWQGVETARRHPRRALSAVATAGLTYLYYSSNARGGLPALTPIERDYGTMPNLPFMGASAAAFSFGAMQSNFGPHYAAVPAVFSMAMMTQPSSAQPSTTFVESFGSGFDDRGTELLSTSDNATVVLGETYGFNVGTRDIFIFKRKNGVVEWTYTLGLGGNDYGVSLKESPNKEIVFLGKVDEGSSAGRENLLLGRMRLDGTLVDAKSIGDGGREIAQGLDVSESSGDIYYLAQTNSYGVNGTSLLVGRLTSGLVPVWSQTLGGSGLEGGNYLKLTPNGEPVIFGYTQSFGSNKILIIKLRSSDGATLWSRTIHNLNGGQGVYSSIIKSNGNIVGIGSIYINSIPSALLFELTDDGRLLWANALGGSGSELGTAVQKAGSEDEFYVALSSSGSFGPNYDWLLAQVTNTTSVWAKVLGGQGSDTVDAMQKIATGFRVVGKTDSLGNKDAMLAEFDPNGLIANCGLTRPVTLGVQSVLSSLSLDNVVLSVSSVTPSIVPWLTASVLQTLSSLNQCQVQFTTTIAQGATMSTTEMSGSGSHDSESTQPLWLWLLAAGLSLACITSVCIVVLLQRRKALNGELPSTVDEDVELPKASFKDARNAGLMFAAQDDDEYGKTPSDVGNGHEYGKTPADADPHEYGKTPADVDNGHEYARTPEGVNPHEYGRTPEGVNPHEYARTP